MSSTKEEKSYNYGIYISIVILSIVIAVLSFFLGRYSVNFEKILVKVIDDKRCTDCYTNKIVEQIKSLPDLKNANFEIIDFSEEKAKKIMKENDITKLPAILLKLDLNKLSDTQFVSFLEKTKGGMYSLNVGARYDPYAEICDNGVDDNENGKIDCNDDTCSKELTCAPKVDRPVADLYVMSYCPYGLQAQKRYLEVMSKLSNVADINVKFVPYIMHGQKEADENVVQYCIQKEEGIQKYGKYLKCFLKEEGKEEECKKEANIDIKKLNTCIKDTKEKYKIDEKMADTTRQFPEFDIDKESATEAGVQGSPTFVVNGIKIENIGRNAKSYAEKICSTFKEVPEECKQDFQDTVFDPMFGFTSNGANADSGCGL